VILSKKVKSFFAFSIKQANMACPTPDQAEKEVIATRAAISGTAALRG
jgi:hypothetical protein